MLAQVTGEYATIRPNEPRVRYNSCRVSNLIGVEQVGADARLVQLIMITVFAEADLL